MIDRRVQNKLVDPTPSNQKWVGTWGFGA